MSSELRYYNDIIEVEQTRDPQIVNEKLKDRAWELLAIKESSFVDANVKTVETYPIYILGRRAPAAQGPALITPSPPSNVQPSPSPPSNIQDVLEKTEWRPSKNAQYFWTFVDKLPKDVIDAITAAGSGGLKLGKFNYKLRGDNLNLVGRWGVIGSRTPRSEHPNIQE